MSNEAVILNIDAIYPYSTELNFSIPFDNGIRLINPVDLLLSDEVYYGDEINLSFWNLLRLPFGISSTPESPLTLQPNYLYKYNHTTRVFDVYDDLGVNIIHTENIRSIADMNIDFIIHKSHQFEIIYDGSGFANRFFFPAILVKDIKIGDNVDVVRCWVDNIYLNNEDCNNWHIKHLAEDYIPSYWSKVDIIPQFRKYLEDILFGVAPTTLSYNKNKPENYFYADGFDIYEFNAIPKNPPLFDPIIVYNDGDIVSDEQGYIYAVHGGSKCILPDGTADPNGFVYKTVGTGRIFDKKIGKRYYVNDIINDNSTYYLVKVEFVMTDWTIDIVNTDKICVLLLRIGKILKFTAIFRYLWLVLAIQALSMYPDLMPVERAGETQNNRPIYEPWLIWGFLKFIYNQYTHDDDYENIPVFDLSPRYS